MMGALGVGVKKTLGLMLESNWDVCMKGGDLCLI